MALTDTYDLPYPSGSTVPDVPVDIQALAEATDAALAGVLEAAGESSTLYTEAAVEAFQAAVATTGVQDIAAASGTGTIRNRVPNSGPDLPDPAWARTYGTGASGAATFILDSSAPSKKGYVRMTWTASQTAVGNRVQSPDYPVTPTQTESMVIWVRSSRAQVIGAAMYYYDAAGTQVGSTMFDRLYTLVPGEWTALEYSGAVVPSGAVTGRAGAAVNPTYGTKYLTGDTLDACAVLPVEGSTVYSWFDGDTDAAYWEGEPVLSASVKAAPAAFAAPFTAAPAYAGTRAGRYSPTLNLYQPVGADIGPIRRRIASALEGKSRYRLAAMGDSITAGQGATPGIIDTWRLFTHRAAQVGQACPGPLPMDNNVTGGQDARLTFDPEWIEQGSPRGNLQLHRRCTTAGKIITYVSDAPGTVLDIVIFNSSSPMTYSIDGGAAVTFAGSGGTLGLQTVTVTGLANTRHTVVITSTTTTAAYFQTIAIRNPVGLEVANFGYSGANTADWKSTLSPTSGGTVGNGYNAILKGYQADCVSIALGANEHIWSSTAAILEADLNSVISGLKGAGKDVILTVTTPIQDATHTAWFSEFVPALYNVADTQKVPLLDLSAAWINRDVAAARGWMFDTWHPEAKGYIDIHARYARLLLPAGPL